jgi:hypothetical protein
MGKRSLEAPSSAGYRQARKQSMNGMASLRTIPGYGFSNPSRLGAN